MYWVTSLKNWLSKSLCFCQCQLFCGNSLWNLRFCYFSSLNTSSCRLVSKFWERTISSQTLWIKEFYRKWTSLLEIPNQDSRKGKYIFIQSLFENGFIENKDWRGIFGAKLACERNWKSAHFESIPRQKSFQNQINCVKFYDK